MSDFYSSKLSKFWEATGASNPQVWSSQTRQLLSTTNRYNFIKVNCLEGQEASKNYLRAIFENERLAHDSEVAVIATMLDISHRSMPCLI